MPFVLPADPSPGAVAPASWGDDVRTSLAFLANPPACRVFNGAAIGITSGAGWVPLTFDSERFDTDNMHSTGTNPGRITINTAGIYVVTGHVQWQLNTAGVRGLGIRVNGATFVGTDDYAIGNASLQTTATVYKLAAGDYLELLANQNSGTTPLNVWGSATANGFSLEFAAAWVGTG